ncbi:MAG: hypothetical protein JO129_02570 [Candidatus Dependentiae bacterium]|nr:hypothetical protein [Candidatus Dependentiae bacterium]
MNFINICIIFCYLFVIDVTKINATQTTVGSKSQGPSTSSTPSPTTPATTTPAATTTTPAPQPATATPAPKTEEKKPEEKTSTPAPATPAPTTPAPATPATPAPAAQATPASTTPAATPAEASTTPATPPAPQENKNQILTSVYIQNNFTQDAILNKIQFLVTNQTTPLTVDNLNITIPASKEMLSKGSITAFDITVGNNTVQSFNGIQNITINGNLITFTNINAGSSANNPIIITQKDGTWVLAS